MTDNARRYLAEFVGTFGIVFAPVALSATSHLPGGDGSLITAAFASGFAVLGMVYALGHISKAHFNPAVTVAFAVSGWFPWRDTVPYIASQFLGGIVATLLTRVLFGNGAFGAQVPAVSISPYAAVGIEAVLTFLLMLVIIAVATDKRVPGPVPGLAIGMTVIACVLIGGPATGSSMNPARAFGPALLNGGAALANWWIYLVGPTIGAVIAVLLYQALRGSNGDGAGSSVLKLERVGEFL